MLKLEQSLSKVLYPNSAGNLDSVKSLRDLMISAIHNDDMKHSLEQMLNSVDDEASSLVDLNTTIEIIKDLKTCDLSLFGLDDQHISRIMNCLDKVLQDLTPGGKYIWVGEKEVDGVTRFYDGTSFFKKPLKDLRKLIYSCIFFPEEYEISWGWLRKDEKVEKKFNEGTEDKSDILNEFIEQASREISQREIKSSLLISDLLPYLDPNLSSIVSFLAQLGTYKTWDELKIFLERENQEQKDNRFIKKPELEIQLQEQVVRVNIFSVLSRVGSLINKIIPDISASADLRTLSGEVSIYRSQSQIENSFRILLSEVDQNNFKPAVQLLITFLGDYPKEKTLFESKYLRKLDDDLEKPANIKLYAVSDEKLIQEIYLALLRSEGKSTERYFKPSDFPRYSPYKRLVPRQKDPNTQRALSLEEAQILGINLDDSRYIKMEDQHLFYQLTHESLIEFNKRIAFCIENQVPLKIFIPTCPCDQHSLTQDNEVTFTGGEIVKDAVSWTGLNTIDGISLLARNLSDTLSKYKVKIELIFATGDFEHSSGNPRAMKENDFMHALDTNHEAITRLVSTRLDGIMQNMRVVLADDVLKARENKELLNGKLNMQVNGIMRICEELPDLINVHGQDYILTVGQKWFDLKKVLEPFIEDFLNNPNNKHITKDVINARRKLYGLRIIDRLKGEGFSEKDFLIKIDDVSQFPYEILENELKVDIHDYYTFHIMAVLLWGNDSMIVLAGDSRALEQLASKMTGTYLLSVEGNYIGAA